MSCVYVFDFGDIVKVGYTTDLNTRKISIQSNLKKKVLNTFSIPAPIEVESLAHKMLGSFRIRGEYYSCPFNIACEAVQSAMKVVDSNPKTYDNDKKIKFTMVISQDLAQKLDYIRMRYGRSRIKEIEWASKEWVKQFEQEYGEITPDDLTLLRKSNNPRYP